MSGPARQLRGRAARLARLMPTTGPSTAARTPFVLLVVILLGGGLITLLLLNSSLNTGSFKLSELKKQTTDLTDEQQALQRDVDSLSAPDALQRRARELGMIPGGSPAFLNPDGRISGVPSEAGALPSAMAAVPPVAPSLPASLAPSVEPSASPTGTPAAGSSSEGSTAPATPSASAGSRGAPSTAPRPGPTSGTPTPTTSGR
ncbi:septum formation initiator [Streptomyces niveus]|uniref:Septum formation initiator n=1 Tax=Streptomyces niveus TaxID=193462 RepID=A0ABZ2AC23_STRNV|nr:septum formation initiator [Streptomyces niveus]WTA58366.1 septum formation initiator [Streptomyces niveus]